MRNLSKRTELGTELDTAFEPESEPRSSKFYLYLTLFIASFIVIVLPFAIQFLDSTEERELKITPPSTSEVPKVLASESKPTPAVTPEPKPEPKPEPTRLRLYDVPSGVDYVDRANLAAGNIDTLLKAYSNYNEEVLAPSGRLIVEIEKKTKSSSIDPQSVIALSKSFKEENVRMGKIIASLKRTRISLLSPDLDSVTSSRYVTDYEIYSRSYDESRIKLMTLAQKIKDYAYYIESTNN